jgi:hypothetical protein
LKDHTVLTCANMHSRTRCRHPLCHRHG